MQKGKVSSRKCKIDIACEQCSTVFEAYEPQAIQDDDAEIRRMRERERIKLNDRVYELKRHIEVIKRMYPNGQSQSK